MKTIHRRKLDNPESGWTFIETIIVVAIILILTGTVGISGIRYIQRARVSSAGSEIAALVLALDGYYLDCGNYPTTEQGMNALWQLPTISPVPDNWNGPYVAKKDFEDPWKNAYYYENPGPNGLPFAITSYGADGAEGGEGEDADIVSWESR